MATCPNINLLEWKSLVASRGEDMAYALWDKYNGEVPNWEYTFKGSSAIDKILKLEWLESWMTKTLFTDLINNKLRGCKPELIDLLRNEYLNRIKQLGLPLFDDGKMSDLSVYFNKSQSKCGSSYIGRLGEFICKFGQSVIYSPNQFFSYKENKSNTVFVYFYDARIYIKCSEELSILLKNKPALCSYIDLFSICYINNKEEIQLNGSIIFHEKLTKREFEACKILLLTHEEDEDLVSSGEIKYPTLGTSFDPEQNYVKIDANGMFIISGDYIQDVRDEELKAQNHQFYQNYQDPQLQSTDYSHYDDGLDMDEQSIDFWNQF